MQGCCPPVSNPASTGDAGICVYVSRATQSPLGFRPVDVSPRYIPQVFAAIARRSADYGAAGRQQISGTSGQYAHH